MYDTVVPGGRDSNMHMSKPMMNSLSDKRFKEAAKKSKQTSSKFDDHRMRAKFLGGYEQRKLEELSSFALNKEGSSFEEDVEEMEDNEVEEEDEMEEEDDEDDVEDQDADMNDVDQDPDDLPSGGSSDLDVSYEHNTRMGLGSSNNRSKGLRQTSKLSQTFMPKSSAERIKVTSAGGSSMTNTRNDRGAGDSSDSDGGFHSHHQMPQHHHGYGTQNKGYSGSNHKRKSSHNNVNNKSTGSGNLMMYGGSSALGSGKNNSSSNRGKGEVASNMRYADANSQKQRRKPRVSSCY
eukprot:TRINITY_DN23820_c0_g1_i1.p1 TRINITY_DN23820_c0_g1~~TRINITY_DN23820_c0_g1_i1.p1  ORF type:complete len:292 (-),score=75.77 TRINITY_DN23820_c0_g1_i1:225-1100(-)